MRHEATLRAFHELYSGRLAQELRENGNPDAMPPWTEVTWLGKQVVKCPMDLWVYQEIIYETRPDVLIETGTGSSGSAYYFSTLFDLVGNGEVFTVDVEKYPHLRSNHPRINYLHGSSVDYDVVKEIRDNITSGQKVMVVLDSLHTYEHVRRELDLYGHLVTPGQYLVVEDTGWRNDKDTPGDAWCDRAAWEFVRDNPEFEVDRSRERHLITSNHNGWIRRKVA